jgi:hypothetical protein
VTTISPQFVPTKAPPDFWAPVVRECVQVLGYPYGDGVLAVPEGTWFVATTFSPCPLASEWKHRILRSPHDRGPLGNLCRRTLLTSGGLCDLPGRGCGASDQDAMCSLYSRTLWYAPCMSYSPSPRRFRVSLLLPPSCRTTSSHRDRCAHWTAFGAAPCHFPVPVSQDSALWYLSARDEPP